MSAAAVVELAIGLILGFALGHRHAMKNRRITCIRMIPIYRRHSNN